MPDNEDEIQAEMLADKIVSAGERGVAPNATDIDALATLVESESAEVADALRRFKEEGSEVSVQDMFEMQMLMNHFSQLSEMSTSVISANNAISSMARNAKS
jgi:hypothetical protein